METRQIIQHLRSTTLGVKPNVAEIEEGEISVNLAKGGETLMIKNTENEIVEFKSKEYVDNLVSQKQDTISDLETIRTNAAKGASALQSIPSEYVTESELESKGYLTSVPSEYITATQLQNKGYLTGVPSEYVTESELQGKGYLTSHQDISHLATKEELSGYTTDSEFAALSNTVSQKANTSALSGYSTTGHSHNASSITGGTLNIGRIPTGTTSTTVSRGDHSHSQYLTEHQSLSEYAKLTDVEAMINEAIIITLNTEV